VRTPNEKRDITAFGDCTVDGLAIKAIPTLLRLIEGKPVGEKTEVAISFHNARMVFVPSVKGVEETSAPPK
jgi:hypothetical protein